MGVALCWGMVWEGSDDLDNWIECVLPRGCREFVRC